MIRKYALPIVAVLGVIFAAHTVVTGQREQTPAPPITQPAQPKFDSYVAGAGIVEASTENIAVGTFVPGVVTKVLVKIGDQVKAGAPLFQIDDRDLQADLLVKGGALASTKAKVATESASLADVKSQLEMWQSVRESRAVSKEELDRKRYAVQIQQAKLDQASADVESAQAQLKSVQTELERRLVKAPVDAQVLQVKIRVGEYAPAGVLETPLMLLGDTKTLHVRVDVDENDAWRVNRDDHAPGLPLQWQAATAYIRGNRNVNANLKFVRIEPYVIPKRSLTGQSTERVDTRVLQVIYAFDRATLPIYVGQQMDVFIDAPPASASPVASAAQVPANVEVK